jgi:predicted transcriptional regulator
VLAAFDQGDGPDSRFELTYDDPADVHVVTRPKSQELLRALLQHEPRSIRGTARVVGRDVSQVHRNLTELEELGLVEFVEDGDAKRPTVWYDAVEVTLPLGRPVVEPEERE